MEQKKISLKNEEDRVFTFYKLYVSIALIQAIIPSLRAVAINWKPELPKALLLFIHDGEPNDEIMWHYDCIEVEATATGEPYYQDKPIHAEMKVLALPEPKSLPEVSDFIYLRKENQFSYDKIQKTFPQYFGIGFGIRVTINEALRSRVTPALRAVYLKWKNNKTEALITFVHDGDLNLDVKQHYQEIFQIATTCPWKDDENLTVSPQLSTVSLPYPKPIQRTSQEQCLYARKEPFEDPKEDIEE